MFVGALPSAVADDDVISPALPTPPAAAARRVALSDGQAKCSVGGA